jgi:hypothetical protein
MRATLMVCFCCPGQTLGMFWFWCEVVEEIWQGSGRQLGELN